MPQITPDFSEAQEFTNDPIPDGTYRTLVTDCQIKTSKKGAQYLSWKLSIQGAQGELSKFNNWPIYHTTMISGPGAGMLKTFYKAAMREEPQGPFDTEMLLSKEVEVDVVTEVNPTTGEPSRYPTVKAVRSSN